MRTIPTTNPTRIVEKTMAKYYVQSGSIRGVVDCYDDQCAAVWAVHRVMQHVEEGTPNRPIIAEDALSIHGQGMHMLEETIRVSEVGFDRQDCQVIDSFDAFIQWHDLTRALESMTDKLDEHHDETL